MKFDDVKFLNPDPARARKLTFSSNFRYDFFQLDQSTTAVRAFCIIFFLGAKMSLKKVLKVFLSTPIDFEVPICVITFPSLISYLRQNPKGEPK